MGSINATITGAALPYSVVVRKSGETTGNRCTGSCNNFPVNFIDDAGSGSYYFIVTDANGCAKDSRTVGSGVGTINCDVVCSMSFTLSNPQC